MTEVLPEAESDSGTQPRASSNIRHFCRMEIAGGGQIVIDGNYAYIGHQHRPQGTTILDISDPRKPKILSILTPNHPASHSHKARIVGDIMVVNSEFERGGGRDVRRRAPRPHRHGDLRPRHGGPGAADQAT